MLKIPSVTINSLWIGDKLRDFENITILSHLAHGHKFNLWTYNYIDGVPDRTTLCNASEIVPRRVYEKWFKSETSRHSRQTFSNYFRYNLIYKYGDWWLDMDCVCVRHIDLVGEYVFTGIQAPRRPELKNFPFNIINGAFRAPKGAPFLKQLTKGINPMAEKGQYPKMFGMWGTIALTKSVFAHGLQKHKTSQHVFVPFGYQQRDVIFTNPKLQVPSWAYTVHLYQYKNSNGSPKYYVKGSVYDCLKRKYL
jgi:hypothetical protein